MKKNPPNEYRRGELGFWSSTPDDGMNGVFSIPLPGFGHRVIAQCIVSDGAEPEAIAAAGAQWEHVSVHILEYGKQRTPTWQEMCMVKDIFWDEEECVVQFHPPKSEYVNNHPHVLHLWKLGSGTFPAPPSIFVGIKEVGNLNRTEQEIIVCPQCGRRSSHPMDIKERYCGHCHEWHDNMKGQK